MIAILMITGQFEECHTAINISGPFAGTSAFNNIKLVH